MDKRTETFIALLRETLDYRKLTIPQLSSTTGVDEQTLESWFAGTRLPSNPDRSRFLAVATSMAMPATRVDRLLRLLHMHGLDQAERTAVKAAAAQLPSRGKDRTDDVANDANRPPRISLPRNDEEMLRILDKTRSESAGPFDALLNSMGESLQPPTPARRASRTQTLLSIRSEALGVDRWDIVLDAGDGFDSKLALADALCTSWLLQEMPEESAWAVVQSMYALSSDFTGLSDIQRLRFAWMTPSFAAAAKLDLVQFFQLRNRLRDARRIDNSTGERVPNRYADSLAVARRLLLEAKGQLQSWILDERSSASIADLPEVHILRELFQLIADEQEELAKDFDRDEPLGRAVSRTSDPEYDWQTAHREANYSFEDATRAAKTGINPFAREELRGRISRTIGREDGAAKSAWLDQVEALADRWFEVSDRPSGLLAHLVQGQIGALLSFWGTPEDVPTKLRLAWLTFVYGKASNDAFLFHSALAAGDASKFPRDLLVAIINLPRVQVAAVRNLKRILAQERPVPQSAREILGMLERSFPWTEHIADEAGRILAGKPTFMELLGRKRDHDRPSTG